MSDEAGPQPPTPPTPPTPPVPPVPAAITSPEKRPDPDHGAKLKALKIISSVGEKIQEHVDKGNALSATLILNIDPYYTDYAHYFKTPTGKETPEESARLQIGYFHAFSSTSRKCHELVRLFNEAALTNATTAARPPLNE